MIDLAPYRLADPSKVPSPALLWYPELIRRNIAEAVRIAGGTERLRPHVKAHKSAEIIRLQLDAGIGKFKCATIAEAEMVAQAGGTDVLLAYQLVGPNVRRWAELIRKYPSVKFSAVCDHPDVARAMSEFAEAESVTFDLFLDVDCGMARTGIPPGETAELAYRAIEELPGLNAAGFHVYDGHHRQPDIADRAEAVRQSLRPVLEMRASLEVAGHPVPTLVCGGSPTFPVHARFDEPGLELSPGTFVLHDVGYGGRFADMAGFTPAALVLTRVVSRPSENRLTLDVGTKAIASDPPAGQRCVIAELPDAVAVGHNEEHLVLETPEAGRFDIGDVLHAFPTHVCPTSVLYPYALAVEEGKVVDEWPITARDRVLND